MNKFALAIIGIVAVMAVLIALPNITQQQPATGDLGIVYSKQRMTKIGDDFVATKVELLNISKDGAATYSEADPRLKVLPINERFQVDKDDHNRLKGLILETGFIQIPRTDYLQVAEGVDGYTRYTLTVSTGDTQKTFNWVDAYDGTVPYLIETAGTELDAIIEPKS